MKIPYLVDGYDFLIGGCRYPDVSGNLDWAAREWRDCAKGIIGQVRAARDRTIQKMAMQAIRYRLAVSRALFARAQQLENLKGKA